MDSQSERLDYARGAMTQSPSMCARHCCTLASQHWPVLLYLYFILNFRLVFWELESMFAEELTTLGQHMQLLRWQLFGLKIISMNNHNCLKIISKNNHIHREHQQWFNMSILKALDTVTGLWQTLPDLLVPRWMLTMSVMQTMLTMFMLFRMLKMLTMMPSWTAF